VDNRFLLTIKTDFDLLGPIYINGKFLKYKQRNKSGGSCSVSDLTFLLLDACFCPLENVPGKCVGPFLSELLYEWEGPIASCFDLVGLYTCTHWFSRNRNRWRNREAFRVSHVPQLYRGVQIPCCALLVQQMRATFASGSRMWRAHPAWIWRKCYVRCASCSPRASCKCCVHLPREERATRDVTVVPLCVMSGLYLWAREEGGWWEYRGKAVEFKENKPGGEDGWQGVTGLAGLILSG
jgi:hypothetical protein